MSMSRKDYIVIAQSLKLSKPNQVDAIAFSTWMQVVTSITNQLQINYTNFNRDIFTLYINGN